MHDEVKAKNWAENAYLMMCNCLIPWGFKVHRDTNHTNTSVFGKETSMKTEIWSKDHINPQTYNIYYIDFYIVYTIFKHCVGNE